MKFKTEKKTEYLIAVSEKFDYKTIEDIAKKLKINSATLHCTFSNKRYCSKVLAIRMCKLAGVKLNDYFDEVKK